MGEEINTTTPIGRSFLVIMSALAQMEREQTVERIENVMKYKEEQGEHMGKIPYGYRREAGKLVVNRVERENLESMKELREEGNSYGKITEYFNAQEIPTRKKGGKWHASTVRTILIREGFQNFYK